MTGLGFIHHDGSRAAPGFAPRTPPVPAAPSLPPWPERPAGVAGRRLDNKPFPGSRTATPTDRDRDRDMDGQMGRLPRVRSGSPQRRCQCHCESGHRSLSRGGSYPRERSGPGHPAMAGHAGKRWPLQGQHHGQLSDIRCRGPVRRREPGRRRGTRHGPGFPLRVLWEQGLIRGGTPDLVLPASPCGTRALRARPDLTPPEILDLAATEEERLIKLSSIRVELASGRKRGRYESSEGRWSLASTGDPSMSEGGSPKLAAAADENRGKLGLAW